jgi:hypothetical protein
MVLLLLCAIYTSNGFNSYLTMFGMTARPGNKLVNGMIYGFSEAIAAFSIGFVCKYAPDNFVFIGLTSMCLVSNVGYFFMGGSGGAIAFIFYFFVVFSIGGLITTSMILIELRVPPESLASSLVLIFTTSVTCCALAPTVAYFKQPVPFLVTLAFLVAMIILTLRLPPPGQYLIKATRLTQNLTRIEDDNTSIYINSTLYMPMNGQSFQFGRTYYERKTHFLRQRLSE